MKRLTAILMIALMLLSVTSCKEMTEDSVGVSEPAHADIADNTESDTPETDKTDTKATDSSASDTEIPNQIKSSETPEDEISVDKQSVDEAQISTPDDVSMSENKEDNKPNTTVSEPELKTGPDSWVTITEEKSSPCMATINDDFKGGEVLVTIMREQSAARQEYTSADFPGLDIEDISVSMNYFPDINNNIVLLIKLNKQDKPSVLEAIKVLEQNPIVWSACPNYRLEFVDSVIIGEDSPDNASMS